MAYITCEQPLLYLQEFRLLGLLKEFPAREKGVLCRVELRAKWFWLEQDCDAPPDFPAMMIMERLNMRGHVLDHCTVCTYLSHLKGITFTVLNILVVIWEGCWQYHDYVLMIEEDIQQDIATDLRVFQPLAIFFVCRHAGRVLCWKGGRRREHIWGKKSQRWPTGRPQWEFEWGQPKRGTLFSLSSFYQWRGQLHSTSATNPKAPAWKWLAANFFTKFKDHSWVITSSSSSCSSSSFSSSSSSWWLRWQGGGAFGNGALVGAGRGESDSGLLSRS